MAEQSKTTKIVSQKWPFEYWTVLFSDGDCVVKTNLIFNSNEGNLFEESLGANIFQNSEISLNFKY
jgi:hypothetical protein